jgi:hypothetical protein
VRRRAALRQLDRSPGAQRPRSPPAVSRSHPARPIQTASIADSRRTPSQSPPRARAQSPAAHYCKIRASLRSTASTALSIVAPYPPVRFGLGGPKCRWFKIQVWKQWDHRVRRCSSVHLTPRSTMSPVNRCRNRHTLDQQNGLRGVFGRDARSRPAPPPVSCVREEQSSAVVGHDGREDALDNRNIAEAAQGSPRSACI